MKIIVRQSGGFAGITLPSKVLETDDEQIKILAREVLNDPTGSNDVADGIFYEITVEEDGKISTAKLQHHGGVGSKNLNELMKVIK